MKYGFACVTTIGTNSVDATDFSMGRSTNHILLLCTFNLLIKRVGCVRDIFVLSISLPKTDFGHFPSSYAGILYSYQYA